MERELPCASWGRGRVPLAVTTGPALTLRLPLAGPASTWVLQEIGVEILREVAHRCGRAGIPMLPVKGVVTSRVLYGDVCERPITDVDIRVRRRDLEAFRSMAAATGWRCIRVLRSYRNLVYDFGPLTLDVEAGVGPPGLCALDVDSMLERSEEREIVSGCRVAIPELHDHAVLLVVNAFKDKIVTAPAWAITDLERVIGHPQFDREEFVERVGESRITTIAWVVAAWMESVRNSAGWGSIRTAIEARGNVRRSYAKLVQGRMATAGRAPLSLRLLARVAADSRRMQMEAVAHAAACVVELWLRGLGSS